MRFGEYALLAADELRRWMAAELERTTRVALSAQRAELDALRLEIQALRRQLDRAQRPRRVRKIGRWVPGGPGRPPKDAVARAEAFAARQKPKSPRRS